MVDGYLYVDHLNWDSFNESSELLQAVENYKERFGFYPEAILADKIYRNRDNRSYCKSKGIRLSGPPLGCPPRDSRPNKKLEKQDMKERNEIEGYFEGNEETAQREYLVVPTLLMKGSRKSRRARHKDL